MTRDQKLIAEAYETIYEDSAGLLPFISYLVVGGLTAVPAIISLAYSIFDIDVTQLPTLIKDKVKHWLSDEKLQSITQKLKNDPEIINTFKHPKTKGWQNEIQKKVSEKLSPEELNYIQKLSRHGKKTISEELTQPSQTTQPSRPSQSTNSDTQKTFNIVVAMSQDLNPRLPKPKILQAITSITNAMKSLSQQPGPLQSHAKVLFDWLAREVPHLHKPQAALSWGFVATKLGEEINKLREIQARATKQ
jgi:hypothetical protein